MKNKILVVGSLNMDLVVRAPRHPEIGETIIGRQFSTFPGGKGANQAVAAARLGGAVAMIGRVGKDAFGDELLEVARKDGVNTDRIIRDPGSVTGVALITVDDSGQNTIVVASGANFKLTPQDVLAAESEFENAGVLLCQLESPLPAIECAVEIARKHGVQVILNPAPAFDLNSHLLKNIDYLIPNQNELALLSGIADVDLSIQNMRVLGVRRILVTLGAEGVLLVEGDHRQAVSAYDVVPVDSTAAGDAFCGAFAVALTEGRDFFQAASWANAAGALTVTRPGAQPSLPTRHELEDFIEKAK